jgi:hypothetical protein
LPMVALLVKNLVLQTVISGDACELFLLLLLLLLFFLSFLPGGTCIH